MKRNNKIKKTPEELLEKGKRGRRARTVESIYTAGRSPRRDHLFPPGD
jgi:hypothetical protein